MGRPGADRAVGLAETLVGWMQQPEQPPQSWVHAPFPPLPLLPVARRHTYLGGGLGLSEPGPLAGGADVGRICSGVAVVRIL